MDKKYKVTKKAMRPASKLKQCFYCQQPIGKPHVNNCVLINKKVTVEATITYDIEVPASWDKEQIEFSRNEGSWCQGNLIEEIKKIESDNGCLCGHVTYTLIKDSKKHYLDE